MPTARHTFYEIKGEPWVEVKPATECATSHSSTLCSSASAGAGVLLRGGTLTVDMIKRTRDEDRELYSKYIVTRLGQRRGRGWQCRRTLA